MRGWHVWPSSHPLYGGQGGCHRELKLKLGGHYFDWKSTKMAQNGEKKLFWPSIYVHLGKKTWATLYMLCQHKFLSGFLIWISHPIALFYIFRQDLVHT